MKKILFLGLIIGAFLIHLSSCTKEDIYWEIQGIQITFVDSYGNVYTGDTITTNELYVRLYFTPEYSSALRRSLPFINRAYAAQEPAYPGLKHSISKMIVTSTKDFNDINAGDDIGDRMRYCGQASIYGNCSNQTLQSFIYNDLQQEKPYLELAYLRFTEKPVNSEQKLTIRFIDSQGKEFVGVSSTFYWK